MPDPHVITALVKRRAELAGDIENTHKHLRKLADDLEAIDRSILMFDPDYQVEAIHPKVNRPGADWAARGEMSRAVLSVLRMASAPLTSREIAIQIMQPRAMDTTDRRLLRLMTQRVAGCLRDKRRDGLVRSTQGPGQYNLWEVVR